MQNNKKIISNDDVDIRELFIKLWAHKLFIMVACLIGIFCGGLYILGADNRYTSTAIFKLDLGKPEGLQIGSELAGLANYIGVNNAGGSNSPVDKIKGRIFIKKISDIVDFKSDTYFNKYNPNYVDPYWKARIKQLIGWKKADLDADEIIWQGIKFVYSESIKLEESKEGSFIIEVTHENADRAALIANVIMETIISESREELDLKQDSQLNYLSTTLAEATYDLEKSQEALKTFALENSALPIENFAIGSLQLDALREQLNRTMNLLGAVRNVASLIKMKTLDQKDYENLREKFPIVDQVEFRRVLGQNEIISSWSWPEESSVIAVLETLKERKKRLLTKIDVVQIEAERSRRALEVYGKLQRQEKIAEATYTVLIEQVKAQSMMAGYRPDRSEIYEYAAPSIFASEPKRNIIFFISAISGSFVGCIFVLIFSAFRDVYYTKSSIISAVQAQYYTSAKQLLVLRKQSLIEIQKSLKNKSFKSLRDLSLEIHKSGKTQILVTSLNAKLNGYELGRCISSYMQSEKFNIAVVNLSSISDQVQINLERIKDTSFVVTESNNQVSILKPDNKLNSLDFMSQKGFLTQVQNLAKSFDLIFLCADNDDALCLVRAIDIKNTYSILIARTRQSQQKKLAEMHKLFPIQGLLHD
jgi:uncharacterized protein involved in exopolysaccharide biosynthesis